MKYPAELIQLLLNGGYAVIPTDTIYGIVCRAADRRAVERLYEIRRRQPAKPFIVLVATIDQLEQFGVDIDRYRPQLQSVWPGPTSVILPCRSLTYLHRGTDNLAFRLPAKAWLRRLLAATGPLVAPSANPEGEPPATTIDQARAYFGSQVGHYLDGGEILGQPSAIIQLLANGTFRAIR